MIATITASLAVVAVTGSATPAGADTIGPIDFESYSQGSINGQDGWTKTGSFDVAVSDNSTIPGAPVSFGAQSLRVSDAVTSGSFGDQTYSKATLNAAGEPGADTAGFPTGTMRTNFSASFDFASVTPNAEQAGLHMQISPDRGDGARMSYVRIDDAPTGWNLFFQDYTDAAPLGSGGNLDDGCSTGDIFNFTQIATGISRTAHTLRFDEALVPGPHNDVVKIYLDGNLIKTGTSWEDYYRYCSESGGGTGGPLADKSRIVRNLIIREAGAANPANVGNGFLVDNLSLSTASVPDAPTGVTAVAGDKQATVSWTAPSGNDSNVTGYVVYRYNDNGIFIASNTFNSTATTQTITGLQNGGSYKKFKVAAINAIGEGPMSAFSNSVLPIGPPTAPNNVSATACSKCATVSWTAPTNNNGSPITGYIVYRYNDSGIFIASNTFNSTATTQTITGLQTGGAKKFKVSAFNAAGEGPMSAFSNSVTPLP